MYYDFSESVKYIKPHRVLAINRGENEKVLTVNIDVNIDAIESYLESKIIKKDNKVISSVKGINKGDKLDIELTDGVINTEVI